MKASLMVFLLSVGLLLATAGTALAPGGNVSSRSKTTFAGVLTLLLLQRRNQTQPVSTSKP